MTENTLPPSMLPLPHSPCTTTQILIIRAPNIPPSSNPTCPPTSPINWHSNFSSLSPSTFVPCSHSRQSINSRKWRESKRRFGVNCLRTTATCFGSSRLWILFGVGMTRSTRFDANRVCAHPSLDAAEHLDSQCALPARSPPAPSNPKLFKECSQELGGVAGESRLSYFCRCKVGRFLPLQFASSQLFRRCSSRHITRHPSSTQNHPQSLVKVDSADSQPSNALEPDAEDLVVVEFRQRD